jgi:hypothetical protein
MIGAVMPVTIRFQLGSCVDRLTATNLGYVRLFRSRLQVARVDGRKTSAPRFRFPLGVRTLFRNAMIGRD